MSTELMLFFGLRLTVGTKLSIKSSEPCTEQEDFSAHNDSRDDFDKAISWEKDSPQRPSRAAERKMIMDCLFCSAGSPGARCRKKAAPRSPRKELLNMLLQVVCGQAILSLAHGHAAPFRSFRKEGPGGKPFCKRVFPLAVRFLKVISPPTSGANAIIQTTKRAFSAISAVNDQASVI